MNKAEFAGHDLSIPAGCHETTPRTRAKAIPLELTKAQRQALTTPWVSRRTGKEIVIGVLPTRNVLFRLGLITARWTYTPLGLAVRDLLIAERASGEVGL